VLRWCSSGGGHASGEAELLGGGFSEEELHHGNARCPHERMRKGRGERVGSHLLRKDLLLGDLVEVIGMEFVPVSTVGTALSGE
jgi:hypothetical protein